MVERKYTIESTIKKLGREGYKKVFDISIDERS